MDVELLSRPQGQKYEKWADFLTQAGLTADDDINQTVLIWDEGQLIATGSRCENLLKCIAVDRAHRGEDLTATLLTRLRQDAFHDGYRHLFLYTKPENRHLFSSLFFYPVAQTDKVLLMENRRDGIREFLKTLTKDISIEETAAAGGPIGAIVMNCNPFTLGHRYLIETAAKECARLFVFVLSEDKSLFSATDRLEMVKLGTQDISNVIVLPTGPYLISSATFPTYFLKERDTADEIHCQLDIELFTRYYVPEFFITRRYVGTEPFSAMTNRYNLALKAHLPAKQIELKELPRFEINGTPVSASAVRTLIAAGQTTEAKALVPQTTFDYLQAKGLF